MQKFFNRVGLVATALFMWMIPISCYEAGYELASGILGTLAAIGTIALIVLDVEMNQDV